MMTRPEGSKFQEKEAISDIEAERLLNRLMHEHATELKRIAYLYIHDLSECEDIIQEVYISCFQHLATFRNEANYKTWLIRITINKCKDHQRRWNIKHLVYRPFTSLSKKEESAEDQFLHHQNSKEIMEQIAVLPIKFKEVLILYYFQEMTMQEISEILSINHNTVKSRLLRGKNALMTSLERRN